MIKREITKDPSNSKCPGAGRHLSISVAGKPVRFERGEITSLPVGTIGVLTMAAGFVCGRDRRTERARTEIHVVVTGVESDTVEIEVDGGSQQWRAVVSGVRRNDVFFAVGNIAEHSGFVTSRVATEIWSSDNEGGWTYQDVCGAHGTVLHEGTENECRAKLDTWLECSDDRCYTHRSQQ